MVKRSVLIAALLVAILGALGIASVDEGSKKTSEPVVLPSVVVLPRNDPQDARETRTDVFTVTAYCPCEKCCGAYASGYTATGAKATQGVTVAADPAVMPMGTEIELDGHTYTVQDTGGAIAGNRLDLYFDSHEDALRWGVQEKIVRWSA
nr:MAG TPA: lytic transglycosylase [Caudoviricetes sp.]